MICNAFGDASKRAGLSAFANRLAGATNATGAAGFDELTGGQT